MMLVASCIPFPFPSPCDAMLIMLVSTTHWLSLPHYTLTYMSMHESCLLMCHPYFNTMKLWIFDLNLHLSLADTTFCLFVCLLSRLFVHLTCPISCHIQCLPCLSCLSALCLFICSLHHFLPFLVCWFLVFTFACTHMEQECIELGHGLPGASKDGAGTSMSI